MKRLLLLGIVASTLSLNTGCYVLHGLFGCGTCQPCGFGGCGPCQDSCAPSCDSCGPCSSSSCCSCEPGPLDLFIQLFNHDCYPCGGCGEVYWGDGCGERCDPCDRCGNYTGRGCGYGPEYGPDYGPGPATTVVPDGTIIEPEGVPTDAVPAPQAMPAPTMIEPMGVPAKGTMYRKGQTPRATARPTARPREQAARPRTPYYVGEPKVISVTDEAVTPAANTQIVAERRAAPVVTQPTARTASKTEWKPARTTLR